MIIRSVSIVKSSHFIAATVGSPAELAGNGDVFARGNGVNAFACGMGVDAIACGVRVDVSACGIGAAASACRIGGDASAGGIRVDAFVHSDSEGGN